MLILDQACAHLGTQPQQVPFRHSKLTELFQSFFLGQGRAVRLPLPAP
jgi:hypothetical protein